MSEPVSPIERLLSHDRAIVLGALTITILLAWSYTLAGVGMAMNAFEMTNMPAINIGELDNVSVLQSTWNARYFMTMLAMWWFMMVAMMLPSATPTILLAAALNRRSQSAQSPYGKTIFFTSGYLLIWFVFSVGAVISQWVLESNGLITSMLQNASKPLAAGLLIAAGVWQYTPLKQSCLRHCRSPVDFLTQNRRQGNSGALLMGIIHGSYCLGCCWFLMGLLFVACIMNVYWIIGLTLFVLIEKLIAKGPRFEQTAGLGLIIAGLAWLMF